jgi:hypothetical protein
MAIDTNKDMRWMTNNFLESGYASFVATSTATGYSIDTMIDPLQRTEVFKFGGRFLIETGVNNKIYINGNTYTVASADYNSASALVTAINTAITASGVTCYYSETTLDFYFSKATSFTLSLATTTDSIWETIGFATGADLVVAGLTNQYGDETRIHWPYEEITIDFGYQASIGFVGIIGDLAEEIKIPQGATIEFFGNTVNSFVTPPLDQTLPWYESGIFKFIDDINDSAWRYVKIRITCPTAPQQIEIGYLYVGDYSNFPDRNIANGFEFDYDDQSILSSSDSGQIYGIDKTPLRVLSGLNVGLAMPACASFLKNIYMLKQLSTPFFISLDPKSFLSDSFDDYLAFVRFSSPPKHKHLINKYFELSFELKEAI